MKTKLGALVVAVGVAALCGVMLSTVHTEAQRRGARRGGAPFVRASAGNITINVPIQDAPSGDAQPNRQALLGSAWSCAATRGTGGVISVSCQSGDSRFSMDRQGCQPLTVNLESPDAPTYALEMGCE